MTYPMSNELMRRLCPGRTISQMLCFRSLVIQFYMPIRKALDLVDEEKEFIRGWDLNADACAKAVLEKRSRARHPSNRAQIRFREE